MSNLSDISHSDQRMTTHSSLETQTFHWNDTNTAKKQFDSAFAVIEAKLDLSGISYVLCNEQVVRRLGDVIPPPPVRHPIAPYELWLKEKHYSDKKNEQVDKDFTIAMGILRTVFPHPSMVHTDLRNAMNDHVNNSDKFNACIEMLKSKYKPSSAYDTNRLRQQLQDLDDSDGIIEYQQKFNTKVAEIRSIRQDIVSDAELTQWVKDAIKNEEVYNKTVNVLAVIRDEFDYNDIFQAINRYLQNKPDYDPYAKQKNILKADALTIGTANNFQNNRDARIQNNSRKRPFEKINAIVCTRCSRPYHTVENCGAKYCNICNSFIGRWVRSCPNQDKHPSESTSTAPTVQNVLSASSELPNIITCQIDASKSRNALMSEMNAVIKQVKAAYNARQK